MIENRPDFKDINSYDEFKKYYWYREELAQICKSQGLEYSGTKQELNHIIEQYFLGNPIQKRKKQIHTVEVENIDIHTPLLHCKFSFNAKFREYFASITGISPFHFTADMATAWRKVKSENNQSFSIQDMLKVYYGESDYAKYDHSVCQWNQFLKDFCKDEHSSEYTDKLKVASILWKKVRNSEDEKVFSKGLLAEYSQEIAEYRINEK